MKIENLQLPITQKDVEERYSFLKDEGQKLWYYKWIRNMSENYATIKYLFKEKNRSLTSFPKPQNKPLIIVGGGASLNDSSKYLKDWAFSTMTGVTTSSVFKKEKVVPDFLFSFDSLHTMVDNIKDFDWEGTSLITHPMSDPKLFDFWKEDIYFFRRIIKGMEIYELVLPLMFPEISMGIVMTSNVVNNMLTVAGYLGFSSIFLFGVDLSYTKEKMKCDIYDKDFNCKPGDFDEYFDKNILRYYDNDTDIITTQRFVIEKKLLYDLWGSINTPIFNCSKNSILLEMPYVDPEEVVKKQGRGFETMYEGFNKRMAIYNFNKNLEGRKLVKRKIN